MRVGILTHPQSINYGGILQCYALSTYLKKLGHTPIVIRRTADAGCLLKRIVRAILKVLHFPRYYHPNTCDKAHNIRPFVEKQLNRTRIIDSQHTMKNICADYDLQAVIVGSDQVWRADYALNFGYNYFLDFVPSSIKKLSYAASFGLSEWQYDEEQTLKIKEFLSHFQGISVREEEAVALCQKKLEITPRWLIDPTMLLTDEDYNRITSPRILEKRYVFVYWLGEKSLVAKDIEKYKHEGYKIVDINLRDNRELESVEDWLSYIKYADYIITDSFHGCVFSILFKKCFVLRMNQSGGTSRLKSLFEMLNITLPEDGLVSPNYDHLSLDNYKNNSFEYLSKILR